MKIACGTDIIEIERIQKAIENTGEKFLEEIFTPHEVAYCESKKRQKYQHYAARFAAKEATFKALRNMLKDRYSLSWLQIEVVNDEMGKPNIHLINRQYKQVLSMDISLSHCKIYAVAQVVVLYEEEKR